MSHSEAGPSRRRRQYVSRACNSCRRRRCKCDGVQPQCGPCSSSGHECTWGAETEESGRPATKQLVESLRVKVQQLESELMQIKQEQNQTQSALSTPISPSGSLADPSSVPIEPVWSVSAGDSPQTCGVGQKLSEIHLELMHQSPLDSQTLLGISHPVQPVQLAPVEDLVASLPFIAPPLKYQYIFNIDTTVPLDEHYPSHRASLTCQWNRHLPNLSPIQLSRFEHDAILFRLFSYGASCSFGLLPDLFLAEFLQYLAPETTHSAQVQGSRYYTPILHCSLMAFGAAFSDSPEIRSNETRAKFARHAKGWLDEEFSHPSPSLMVSLALLSEYHSGIGERNTGHMYMGMAIRAARAQLNSSNHLVVQNWHRWSTFVQGKYHDLGIYAWRLIHAFLVPNRALEINRPAELPPPRASISCPIATEPDSRPPLTDSLVDLLSRSDFFKYSSRCFIETCRLMVIATRMIDRQLNDQQTTLDIHLQLETWFNALPESALIRQRSPLTFPPVLTLHITYWWFILHSHLPLTEQLSTSTPEPVRDLSIKMSTRATEKLVQLFTTFDSQFGFRYFPRNLIKSIHACGSALVIERDSASSASRKKRATATEGIDVCINALKTIGDIWPVAIRMCEELESLAGEDPSD